MDLNPVTVVVLVALGIPTILVGLVIWGHIKSKLWP